MILREATIQYKGYDPDKLSKGSRSKICCSCNECGRIRWGKKCNYRDLCVSCAQKLRMKLPKPKFVNEFNRFISNTGIDRILTIEKFGYDPIDLSKGSSRKVIRICKGCNEIREIKFDSYRDLCYFCSQKLEETSIKKSCTEQGISREDFGSFVGKQSRSNYILPQFQCIHLNKKFNNSHFHHITKSIGIYVPGELHNHIYHDIRKGLNMGEMNMLALQFINGGL